MVVQPYLFFNGVCEEAVRFYQRVLGATILDLLRYGDSPDPPPPGMLPPGSENKIMHASLRIGESTVMMSDGYCQGSADFRGISLSLRVEDAAEAQRVFAALCEGGGHVGMPLAETFFSPSFGMLADRFGVGWMVLGGLKQPDA